MAVPSAWSCLRSRWVPAAGGLGTRLSLCFVLLLLGACWQLSPAPAPGWPRSRLCHPCARLQRGRLLLGGSAAAGQGSCLRSPHRVMLCPAGLEQRLLHRVGDYADQRNSGEGESASPVRSQQGGARSRSRTGGAVDGGGGQTSRAASSGAAVHLGTVHGAAGSGPG